MVLSFPEIEKQTAFNTFPHLYTHHHHHRHQHHHQHAHITIITTYTTKTITTYLSPPAGKYNITPKRDLRRIRKSLQAVRKSTVPPCHVSFTLHGCARLTPDKTMFTSFSSPAFFSLPSWFRRYRIH